MYMDMNANILKNVTVKCDLSCFKDAYTVKPVLVATSIKQATCLKRPVLQFPIVTNKTKFTCIKQAQQFSVIPWVIA